MTDKQLQSLLDEHEGMQISQIAQSIGWSTSTVRRVINERENVHFQTPLRDTKAITDKELLYVLDDLLPEGHKEVPFGLANIHIAKILGITINQLTRFKTKKPIISLYTRPIQEVSYDEMYESIKLINDFQQLSRIKQAKALDIPMSSYIKWIASMKEQHNPLPPLINKGSD